MTVEVACSTLSINLRRATCKASRQASPFASLLTLSTQEKATSSSSKAVLKSSIAHASVVARESSLMRWGVRPWALAAISWSASAIATRHLLSKLFWYMVACQ